MPNAFSSKRVLLEITITKVPIQNHSFVGKSSSSSPFLYECRLDTFMEIGRKEVTKIRPKLEITLLRFFYSSDRHLWLCLDFGQEAQHNLLRLSKYFSISIYVSLGVPTISWILTETHFCFLISPVQKN